MSAIQAQALVTGNQKMTDAQWKKEATRLKGAITRAKSRVAACSLSSMATIARVCLALLLRVASPQGRPTSLSA